MEWRWSTSYTLIIATLVILALIIAPFVHHANNSNTSTSIRETGPTGIKGYCLINAGSLECKFSINNTYNDNVLYLKGVTVTYNNTTGNVMVGLKGVSVSPHSQSNLVIHFMNNTAILYLESYNREITHIIDTNTGAGPLISRLEDEELYRKEYNLTIYHIIMPGEGVILPLDYHMNTSNSSRAAIIHIKSNTTNLYLDAKEFAWNDILYYELSRYVHMNDYVLIPLPGSNQEYVISRIAVNVINEDNVTANTTISGYIYNVPSLLVDFNFIGSSESIQVPAICYECLVKTTQGG